MGKVVPFNRRAASKVDSPRSTGCPGTGSSTREKTSILRPPVGAPPSQSPTRRKDKHLKQVGAAEAVSRSHGARLDGLEDVVRNAGGVLCLVAGDAARVAANVVAEAAKELAGKAGTVLKGLAGHVKGLGPDGGPKSIGPDGMDGGGDVDEPDDARDDDKVKKLYPLKGPR
ncbi:hypothetical protein [Corallococcus silvisoli]|uniref:hypothetical protein n=1 Tax=Corallococcus silvisoli TaxID=2697031 RepID=UPI001378D036|nr:hypothetical protein [Corallococcus silvisoli]NBD08272.1 hypothetical protein [Corallococcus silvisoli]